MCCCLILNNLTSYDVAEQVPQLVTLTVFTRTERALHWKAADMSPSITLRRRLSLPQKA
ncbi:hypothetical protein Plhal304r1_c022g0076351 [Plasmopara halstedii]